MVTCENEIALIAAYVASELSPQILVAFEKHLQDCRECAAFLQTYKKTIEITRAFLKAQFLTNVPRKLALRSPNV